MPEDGVETNVSVVDTLLQVVCIWALVFHGYVWGVATALSSPLDVLGMVLAIALFVLGALSLLGTVLWIGMGLFFLYVAISDYASV